MKRVVLQCSDVSSFRNVVRRCASTSAYGASRFKNKQRPPHSRKGSEQDVIVAPELREVLSPEACGWLEGKPYKADKKGKRPLTAVFDRQKVNPPSMEKMTFDAMDTVLEDTSDSAFVDADEDLIAVDPLHIPAGTLVEIRRSGAAMRGIVLFSILYKRRWIVHTLATNGEVWTHHEHDVTFQIPEFVPKKLVDQCGLWENAQSDTETAARVDVVKRLRAFEKRFEYDCHQIPELARSTSFYDRVAHPDGKTWSQVTTRQAAEMLLGKTTMLTADDLFAVQVYLFDHGDLFVSEARRFLQTQIFWVRPRQEVEDIRTVHRIITHKSPALDTFLSKARTIVLDSRKRALDSYHEPPSRQPLDDIQWTTEDKAIMRFLVASMQNRRIIQADPYAIPLAHILKKLGLYTIGETETYDVRVAHQLLVELGLVAPWEELNTRQDLKRESPLQVDLAATKSTPILPSPLGPDDFYSHDIAESIRHDFGDTPVYVVDDWDAEELDDGISVERIPSDPEHTWLHIHVADPTVLLPPTHRLARHAMEMSTAYYFVDRTVPMLPRDAQFHKFSLGNVSGQPEPVLTFSLKTNSSGAIVDYKVRPSVVRNVRIIRYDEVDSLIGAPPHPVLYPFGKPLSMTHTIRPFDDATAEDFRLLQTVTHNLTRHRLNNGAIHFAFGQPDVTINPRPLPHELLSTDEPHTFRGFPSMTYAVLQIMGQGARAMISESMMAAGRVASLFFRDRGIPALRRAVGALQVERKNGLENLLATRQENGAIDVFEAMRNRVSAPAASYTTTPGGHSLLGIPEGEGYMKVTSPLRRFGDMLAHWQIKHALLAERDPVLFDEAWLRRMSEDLGSRELEAKRTEGRQQQFWAHSFLLRWIHDPAHEKRAHDPLRSLKARITDGPLQSARYHELLCKVNIPELGLHGRIGRWPVGRPVELGDEVEVEIERIQLGTHPLLDVKVVS
ncbi:RNB-domain-containing protein [Lentinus tigrinus ALCF2SS1-7]|uniref:RNB-domain-containing protein n=1 Tax=Lentinus tigrinus ALCF2SS1-6 TaxID=1328759 RepID=A0A5C2SD40_9APHY|nr:RNB-domain-containing protein [Lentinus tigrinus ALCF2SS1-6]RPD75281.1 RNB-domain-containing protein [Lentinus tigrinus ALCF2SS1-7]